MKLSRFSAPLVLALLLGGCADPTPAPADDAPAEKPNGAGVSFTLTTQNYNADAGSYDGSITLESASPEQIRSAIQSHDWSPGPIRPMVKLIRLDSGEATAYLHLSRDQDSGETIRAEWQSVAEGDKFDLSATLADKDEVIKIALMFANDEALNAAAVWSNP